MIKNLIDNQLEEKIYDSELKRLQVFLMILLVLLVLINLVYVFINDQVLKYFKNEDTYRVLVFSSYLFTVYEAVIYYLHKKRKKPPKYFYYINAFIEISLPSLALLFVIFNERNPVFLDSPTVFIYVIIIIVSALHLDFKYSFTTGFISALSYSVITFFAFQLEEGITGQKLSLPIHVYYIRALIFFICGIVAGIIGQQLKTYIKTLIDSNNENYRILNIFSQQVSHEVAVNLLSGDELIKRKNVAVLFLDIENFSSLADSIGSDKLIEFQNEFFSDLIEISEEYGAIVHQILGDGFMISFGLNDDHNSPVQQSVNCAVSLVEFSYKHFKSHMTQLKNIRIGIAYGAVSFGNIGNNKRKQFSLSGTPVIQAARLEQLNKKFDSNMMVNKAIYDNLSEKKELFSEQKNITLKGFEDPSVYYSYKLEQ